MLVLNARVPIVEQLAFGYDGQRLYAAGTQYGKRQFQQANHGIDVWHFSGQTNPDGRLLPDWMIKGFVVNPAGKWLYASADQYIRARGAIDSSYFAIDTATGQPTRLGLTPYTRQPAIHPSGDWFIGCGCIEDWSKTRIVRWRQPPNGPPEREWEWTPSSHDERPWHLTCDLARSRILSFEGGYQREQGLVGHLVCRDPNNWVVKEQFPLADLTFGHILISPDRSWLIALAGPLLHVRETGDLNREARKIRDGKLHFTEIAFHPSGRYLAATRNDQTVKLYDTTTWQVAKTFTWDIGKMRSIAFSPDGTLAAAGSDTGKVVVWDVDV
jgi:WD40 repeat protein